MVDDNIEPDLYCMFESINFLTLADHLISRYLCRSLNCARMVMRFESLYIAHLDSIFMDIAGSTVLQLLIFKVTISMVCAEI